MKKILLFLIPFIASPMLIGCNKNESNNNGYGVLLGANEEDIDKLLDYKSVCIDLDEFSQESIQKLKNKNIEIYAYLSIGSLEDYRSYYEEFKDITFMPYKGWGHECWVDVSHIEWQSHISSEADRLKTMGADGIFMDNFDVYYFASEVYEERTAEFIEGVYQGCYNMLDDLTKKDMKLMMNSGTDFISRCKMVDEETPIDKVDVYAQEAVFSKFTDVCIGEGNCFQKQVKSEQDYLMEYIDIMSDTADILLIEYAIDKQVIKEIKDYCNKNNFYYYITNSSNLDA